MARGKEVLPAISSVDFRYGSAAEMPWERIEEAAQKSFTLEERKEIHHCADGFDWDYHHYSQAPPLREVNRLRHELLAHCNALVLLAEVHQPVGREEDRKTETDVVSALQIYCGTQNFDFREAFHAVALAAAQISEGLRVKPDFRVDTIATTPETAGLRAFLFRVLDGAETVRARSTPPGRFVKDGFEYRRWGIPVGPRTARFAKFTSAVLSRDVTEGMLRKAWPQDF